MRKNRIEFKNGSIIFLGKKFHLIGVALFVIFIYFLYSSINKTNDNNRLIKDGVVTSAVVTDVRKVGGKGVVRCSYFFNYNGEKYTGKVDDDFYQTGDTIQVLFLRENPKINRERKFLEK